MIVSNASVISMINGYCGHEAGVRNLRKCLDRVFRKVVSLIEEKKIEIEETTAQPENMLEPAPTKDYVVTTQNLEKFLDVPSTDDHYYQNINQQQPIGCSNGLAYIDDGYGSVLKI